MNGGVVNVTGLQNYTGTTTVEAEYVRSNTQQAAADLSAAAIELQLLGTVLQVNKLANGGVASSISNSSSAASNLVLQGGTLRYNGAGDSTDRSFTIGTMGATLDSSGSGAVSFTNTAAPVQDVAEVRTGDLDAFAFNGSRSILYNLNNTADLVVGMPVTDGLPNGPKIPCQQHDHGNPRSELGPNLQRHWRGRPKPWRRHHVRRFCSHAHPGWFQYRQQHSRRAACQFVERHPERYEDGRRQVDSQWRHDLHGSHNDQCRHARSEGGRCHHAGR